jgi:CheY-like chemotaxis protein
MRQLFQRHFLQLSSYPKNSVEGFCRRAAAIDFTDGQWRFNSPSFAGDAAMQPTNTRVLYVEDHEDTRDYVSFLLKRSGFDVTTTGSASAALTLAHSEHFDLYLLDNWLGDVSGFDLCRQLRELDPRTPILFYSAAAYKSDQTAALGCGAQGYLTKPDGLNELTDTIQRLLHGYGHA